MHTEVAILYYSYTKLLPRTQCCIWPGARTTTKCPWRRIRCSCSSAVYLRCMQAAAKTGVIMQRYAQRLAEVHAAMELTASIFVSQPILLRSVHNVQRSLQPSYNRLPARASKFLLSPTRCFYRVRVFTLQTQKHACARNIGNKASYQ